jgi:hypothetical protein
MMLEHRAEQDNTAQHRREEKMLGHRTEQDNRVQHRSKELGRGQVRTRQYSKVK